MYPGLPNVSNENYIGLPNGNVVKSRSAIRVVQSGRWDKNAVFVVQGIPGKPTVTRDVDDHVDIENLLDPHTDAYAAERGAVNTEVQDEQSMLSALRARVRLVQMEQVSDQGLSSAATPAAGLAGTNKGPPVRKRRIGW